VTLPGGATTFGTEWPELFPDGEGPARRVVLPPFRMDAHQVTNQRFAAFVAATGYVTEAERSAGPSPRSPLKGKQPRRRPRASQHAGHPARCRTA